MTSKEARDFSFDENETEPLTDSKVWFSLLGSIVAWQDCRGWFVDGGRTVGDV